MRADGLRRAALAALLLLALPRAVQAVNPNIDDPRAIIAAVEAQETGRTQASTLRITVSDKAGRARVRELSTKSLRVEGASKQLMVFTAPADMRGAGVLSVDHDDPSKPDDQWIYLPGSKKVGSSTGVGGKNESRSRNGKRASISVGDRMCAATPSRCISATVARTLSSNLGGMKSMPGCTNSMVVSSMGPT